MPRKRKRSYNNKRKKGYKNTKYKRPYKRQKASMNLRTGGLLGIERKYLDVAWNNVTINSTTDGSGCELQPSSGCVGCISIPVQGDGASERIGRKYTIKHLFFSGVISKGINLNQSGIHPDYGLFFAMVLDKQPNGATINSEDVYLNPGTSVSAIGPQPLRNLQYAERFEILDSVWIPPRGLTTFTDGTNVAAIAPMTRESVILNGTKDIVCTVEGTSANIANATTNAVHILAFAGTTNYTPTFDGKCRMRFVG